MPLHVASEVLGYAVEAGRGGGLRCPFCGSVLMLKAEFRRDRRGKPFEGDWLLWFICAECLEFATAADSASLPMAAKSAFWLAVGELVQGGGELDSDLQGRVLAALGVSFPDARGQDSSIAG